jgi:hypothetical protein
MKYNAYDVEVVITVVIGTCIILECADIMHSFLFNKSCKTYYLLEHMLFNKADILHKYYMERIKINIHYKVLDFLF